MSQQNEDYGQNEQHYQEQERPDGAAMLAEIINRTEYKVETSYTPFEGTDDNQVKLSPGMVLRFFCKPTKSRKYPTYEDAVRFIMLCKARRLDPREGDAFLVGYDGKHGPEFNLITGHQAFLKRAEAHKEFNGMQSGVIVKHNETEEVRDVEGDLIPDDCILIGGWAKVYRKDREHQVLRRIDLRQYDKGFSLWGTIPGKAMMICKCAEADGLRSAFPNSLGGLYMQDEYQREPEPTATNAEPAKRMSLRGSNRPSPTGGAAGPSNAPPAQNTGAVASAASTGASPVIDKTAPTNSSSLPPTKAEGGESTTAPASGRPKLKKCQCGCVLTSKGECPNCGPQNTSTAEVSTTPSKGTEAAPTTPPAAAPQQEDFPDEEAKTPPAETAEQRRARLRGQAVAEVNAMSAENIDALIGMTAESDDPRIHDIWIKTKSVLQLKPEAKVADLLGPMKKKAAQYIVLYGLLTPAQ